MSGNIKAALHKTCRKSILMKDLNRMTAEELGQVFPVRIADYNPEWPELFTSERKNIIEAVGNEFISRIEHIGSTSVPGLCAKPTIDILLEILEITNCDLLINQLKEAEYHYIPKPENPPPHMMFAKGYSAAGFTGHAYHIHVRYPGDWDEIVFRDYLIMNPADAAEYEALKRKLANEFKNDRENYTESKTAFINNIILKARKES